MKNLLLRNARRQNGWSQRQLADFAQVSLSTIERAERGEPIRVDTIQRLCTCLQKTPEQLGLLHTEDQDVNRRQANQTIAGLVGGLLVPSSMGSDSSLMMGLWPDDLLTIYANGIAACQDLYARGNSQQVEVLLPLYCRHTALMAQQSSPVQQTAAALASQAHQLACRLATHREDFGTALQAGQQALLYAQQASDLNLQVASLIRLAGLACHRKLSAAELQAYEQAVSLLDEQVTPLLKGRTYAGMAKVYAMRGQSQESLRAMGVAYELYPLQPKEDPAYPYLRATRYLLYIRDCASCLFLGQPEEAEQALMALQRETTSAPTVPITKFDLLYCQSEVRRQQGELESTSTILTEAALLAKALGSRLYFNKLVASYQKLQTQWPREAAVVALQEVFQPW